MSDRRIPFPQIPRHPAEGDLPAEPPLEGAPQTAEESVFLSTPELAATANAVDAYAHANSGTRRAMVERYASDFAAHPTRCTDTLDALALLEANSGVATISTLRTDITHGIERFRAERTPSTRALEQWITLCADSPLYTPIAETMLRRYVERCRLPKEITDFLYELTLGGLGSHIVETVQYALKILSLQTPVLTPDMPQARMYILSLFDQNDATLKKAMEIDGVFYYLSHIMDGEAIEQLRHHQQALFAQQTIIDEISRIQRADPVRFRALFNHYERPTQAGGVGVYNEGELPTDFPLTLIVGDIGPLRRLLNDRMALEMQRSGDGQIVSMLDIPGNVGVRGAATLSAMGELVRTQLTDRTGERIIMDTEAHWRTLAFLLPQEVNARTQWSDIADANQQLRRDMVEQSRYLFSPRGDEVEITDSMLRALGFRTITYQMNPRNRRETRVTLAIGNHCTCNAMLDEHFTLRDTQGRGIQLPQHGAFLENVLLSHMHEIRCSERVNEVGGSSSAAHGDRRRAFTSRRAHRRVLPEGQSPTHEQIARILDEYDIDLVRANREREAAGESRRVTYVHEVDQVAVAGAGPVRSRTPEATRQLRLLLSE